MWFHNSSHGSPNNQKEQNHKETKITWFPMWFHNSSQGNNITWCTWHKSMHHDQIMESYTPLNNYLSNCVIKLHIKLHAHPHCWTSMVWSMFLKLLLKHDNSDSNILFLQDPNRHPSSMALIIWTTKDQTLILISSLRINKLFYVYGSSYITKNLHIY
jgi:hypothetical protein